MQNPTGRRKLLSGVAYMLGAALLVMAFLPAMTPNSGTTALADSAAAATRTRTVSATRTRTVAATRTATVSATRTATVSATSTTVPTGGASLSLSGFSFDCTSSAYQTRFVVRGFDPAIVRTYGTVFYVLGGLQKAATFTGTNGNSAVYVDSGETLPPQVTKIGSAGITGANVKLGTDRGDVNLTLPDQNVKLTCGTVSVISATVTSTPGATSTSTSSQAAATSAANGTSGAATPGASNQGGAAAPSPSTAPTTGGGFDGAMPLLMLLGLIFLGAGVALSKLSPSTKA